MAEKSKKLTAGQRRAMPKSSFALPGKDPDVPGAKGQYPIDTAGRARNALARVAQNGSPAEQAKVKAAVRKKYPSIAVDGKKSSPKKGK